MTNDFDGKRVVVTGGTGALGSSVVGALLARGAEVVVPVYAEAELERFPHTDHAAVTIVRDVDLTSEEGAETFYTTAAGDGALWASIHIAGGFAMGPVREMSLRDFDHMLRMNLVTCFLSCREAAKRMGGGGRIVNVGAKPALHPVGGMAAYSASKAGVVSLTQSLSEELSADGIWVNAIIPSIMDTPANRAAMPDADHDAWPSTDDVAASIVFLASPNNAVTRGALVPVYGRS